MPRRKIINPLLLVSTGQEKKGSLLFLRPQLGKKSSREDRETPSSKDKTHQTFKKNIFWLSLKQVNNMENHNSIYENILKSQLFTFVVV